MLQLIEMALNFLRSDPNFSGRNCKNHDQLLMQESTIIQAKHAEGTTKLVKACQHQRDTLAEESLSKDIGNMVNENIDKDVLLFKGNAIKGTSSLTK